MAERRSRIGLPASLSLALASLLVSGCESFSTVGESLLSGQPGQTPSLACLSVGAGVVGLSNTGIAVAGNASVQGSVILLGGSTLTLSGNARITGEIFTRSAGAVVAHGRNASTGTVTPRDLTDHEPRALDFARQAESLTPTQTFDAVTSGTVVTGNGGLNVIEVRSGIRLAGNHKLSLRGSEADQFVFLVRNGGVSLSGNAAIVASDPAQARKALFLVVGDGSISLSGNASAIGTFLAARGPASFSGNGHLEGALIAYSTISLVGNGLSLTPAAWCPQLEAPTATPAPTASPEPGFSPPPSVEAPASPPPPPALETECTTAECAIFAV